MLDLPLSSRPQCAYPAAFSVVTNSVPMSFSYALLPLSLSSPLNDETLLYCPNSGYYETQDTHDNTLG